MPNRSRQVRRVKRRNNKDRFVFTSDLHLIKPYVRYLICIERFISRFGHNDIILYNKTIGFALIQHKDFCPVNILDDPYCLDFIYINENQRSKGHGRRLMNFILKHCPIVLHTLDDSLGFFERISKDLGLEKINTGMPFGITFISSNLDINREPVVNNCFGGCGLKYLGYNRYVCSECYMRFARQNIDMRLIKLNDTLRSKLKKHYQPYIITLITWNRFLEMMYTSDDIDFKKINYTVFIRKIEYNGVTYNQNRSQVIFLIY